jgi:hypothetical protein
MNSRSGKDVETGKNRPFSEEMVPAGIILYMKIQGGFGLSSAAYPVPPTVSPSMRSVG